MPGQGSARSKKQHLSLLRQTEVQLEIFKRFVETSGQALGMADLEGRIFFVNSIFCRMLGRDSPEEVYQQDLYVFYSPETAQRLRQEILPLVRQKGQWVGELSLIDAQGRATPTIENIFLLQDDRGKPLCYATVFTDISERIRLEQELKMYRDQLERLVAERTSELEKKNAQMNAEIIERKQVEKERTRLTAILDSTSDLVGAALPNGQGLYMNAAGRRMAGFGADEDLSKRTMSEVHPAWAWPYVENVGIPTAIAKGVWEGETVIVNHANGTEIPVSQVIMAHRSPNGEIDFISTIIRDISERKRMEEALRVSEEKFRSIVDNMQDAFFRCDLNGELIYTTASAARLLGCASAEEMTGLKVQDFYYNPDDAEKQFEILQSQGKHTHYEVTLKRRDNGQTVVVLANSQFYRDRDGTIIGIEGVYSDITERKQAEEALRKSESRYRLLYDSMRDAYVSITLEGVITEFNEAYVEMLGYQPEELKALSYKDITPEKWHANEEGIQKEQILRQGYSDIFEKEYRRKDGTIFPVELRVFLLRDDAGNPSGMWAIVRDITARKRSEEALRMSEESYRRIVDTANEGIWIVDADLRTTFANARLAEIIGYHAEDMIGRKFESFLFEEDLQDHEKRMEVRKQGIPDHYERRLRHKNGHAVRVLLSATPIVDNERHFQGSFAMITDITERKALEEELIKAQKLDSIGTLAGGLAHDYNNLLTAIMGNIELANVHIAKDNQALAFLAKARNAALTARDLTRQLITFSQGGYPQGTVMPIQELLIESVRLGLSGSKTRTSWRIADDLPEVKIDANQIRQVIFNIVINAQEAMPLGGTLTIEADTIHLGPEPPLPLPLPEGVYVRLVFRDEGGGIKAENLPKVFDPYFTTKDMGSTKGIGLGLSICYSVVKRHAGHIIVESTLGIGTTVTVYIPKGFV